ncbi:tripartite tricarboxylate transporter TctB family protein [Raoultella ornithinolytica]|jgi:putative tricarboxylic transport membrane protein|uniref:tripartite tricarboxylate transporter TctB family protein n=1 Tax=Raoultella ornithinolytica TaxID=54291 RepID=UPI001A1D51BC|nr:tripartite tricarboxylate transporter TctB family protein [Raoultella ornithinolytica]EKX4889539.1 tripartite tricarboxylate transporter TctB family protein [Raoultella ornithinolytica]ELH1429223.1 tripartite tricarboxylate transporter TctB family protein [Raoultella ornithinolytica]MDV0601163.1 tripartite tricarboxylate transporter TctB family protein [Raoultella ornithinolytica]HAT3821558.1 tripartite tricarboxylate transporter TctB family protein [Raoultella ornithinolytica]HCH7892538.1 
MKDRIQTVAYLLCLVVSLLILSMLIFQEDSGANTYGMPSSRLPCIYSGVMAFASLALFIQARHRQTKIFQFPHAWRNILPIQIAILLYAWALYFFGFIVAGMGILFILQWIMGQRRWSILLLLSLLPPPLLWLACTRLLGMALP